MIIPIFVTIVIFFQVVEPAQGDQRCRPEYNQYSSRHSACLAPNNQCNILKKGVDQPHRNQILEIHNDYRSKVAMGREGRGGGMPQAANMLEMTWDDELTSVAEKWAENCIYEHDCNDCRKVQRWNAGQNIAYLDFFCPSVDACRNSGIDVFKPDWPKVMAMFYDEVVDFEQRFLNSFQHKPSIGHFTQIAWASTFKVGCGYTVFQPKQGAFRQFYVCNYGPQGNIIQQPIYKQGAPCSGCPANGGCGQYEGLCKLLNSNVAPIPIRKSEDYLFYCDFGTTVPCSTTMIGRTNWITKRNYHGTYASIILKPGQETALKINQNILPTTKNFCFVVSYRKRSLKLKQPDQSQFYDVLQPLHYNVVRQPLVSFEKFRFSEFALDCAWNATTNVELVFSVPEGSYPHILEIDRLYATDGYCKQRPSQSY